MILHHIQRPPVQLTNATGNSNMLLSTVDKCICSEKAYTCYLIWLWPYLCIWTSESPSEMAFWPRMFFLLWVCIQISCFSCADSCIGQLAGSQDCEKLVAVVLSRFWHGSVSVHTPKQMSSTLETIRKQPIVMVTCTSWSTMLCHNWHVPTEMLLAMTAVSMVYNSKSSRCGWRWLLFLMW